MWWRFGRVSTFRPKGHGLDSRSSRHVGTLGKSLTQSCLWNFGMKFLHSSRAVSVNTAGLEFIKELGQWITVATGDTIETVHVHLFQRLSICTQRHNAIAFKGTFMRNSENQNLEPQ